MTMILFSFFPFDTNLSFSKQNVLETMIDRHKGLKSSYKCHPLLFLNWSIRTIYHNHKVVFFVRDECSVINSSSSVYFSSVIFRTVRRDVMFVFFRRIEKLLLLLLREIPFDNDIFSLLKKSFDDRSIWSASSNVEHFASFVSDRIGSKHGQWKIFLEKKSNNVT